MSCPMGPEDHGMSLRKGGGDGRGKLVESGMGPTVFREFTTSQGL